MGFIFTCDAMLDIFDAMKKKKTPTLSHILYILKNNSRLALLPVSFPCTSFSGNRLFGHVAAINPGWEV